MKTKTWLMVFCSVTMLAFFASLGVGDVQSLAIVGFSPQAAPKETYADEELPGVTEAVESKGWALAREQAKILENALRKNTALLNAMRGEL